MTTILWHVTSADCIESIRENGLLAGSYWAADEELSDYYVETVKDEGKDAVVLQVNMADLYSGHLAPDRPGIAEPISTVIGKSESAIWSEWERSAKDARASLEIVSSVQYMHAISPHLLCIVDGNDAVPLVCVAVPRGPADQPAASLSL